MLVERVNIKENNLFHSKMFATEADDSFEEWQHETMKAFFFKTKKAPLLHILFHANLLTSEIRSDEIDMKSL